MFINIPIVIVAILLILSLYSLYKNEQVSKYLIYLGKLIYLNNVVNIHCNIKDIYDYNLLPKYDIWLITIKPLSFKKPKNFKTLNELLAYEAKILMELKKLTDQEYISLKEHFISSIEYAKNYEMNNPRKVLI